jgi:hypothetical protein
LRYYRIEIGSGATQQVYTSLVGGQNDPGALDVELDIFAVNYATAAGGGLDVRSFARIYGVPLKTIAQANDLNNKPVAIFGGMSKGLPLATAAQSQQGLLARGMIYPALGNWIDVEQTLDLVLAPPSGSIDAVNIAGTWANGTTLASAAQSVLTAAFPGATVNINISANLVLNYDVPFVYASLQQFAQFLRTVSIKIMGASGYLGVNVVQQGNTISVYDGTAAPSSTKAIKFQDLIGQPTWLGFAINFKTVMRGDISVGDMISMPPALTVATPAVAVLPQNSVSFAGNYMVSAVRHCGRFRQPDAASWCTIVDAVNVANSTAAPGLGSLS